MGLIDNLRRLFAQPAAQRSGYDWATLVNGQSYPLDGLSLTMPGGREEAIESSFDSYVSQAYKGNGVVFACMRTRMSIFSEARYQFRSFNNGVPGKYFGTPALSIMEHPWPNGSTGDLLTRAITDVDIAGNFYATRRNNRIIRLRPDWVEMVMGSHTNPELTSDDIDAEFLGIVYYPGGKYRGGKPVFLQRSEIAHFAPIPDPTAHIRGMSWITPIVREVMGDSAATSHKLRFFDNGATPNLVIKRPDAPAKQAFDEWRTMMEAGHAGAANAYKTLYLTAGADATPVGTDFKQMDFKVTQGAGETRIAAAAGVHPVLVPLSEGMQGSSLNAGNFNSARRSDADITFRPLWRNFGSSMETLCPPPKGAELTYDPRDIAFLREDRKDAAEIQQIKAQTIRQLVDGGFEPKSVLAAIEAEDMVLLKHTGKLSVQLRPPGEGESADPAVPDTNPVTPAIPPKAAKPPVAKPKAP